jgi:hypothetical protein
MNDRSTRRTTTENDNGLRPRQATTKSDDDYDNGGRRRATPVTRAAGNDEGAGEARYAIAPRVTALPRREIAQSWRYTAPR